MRNNKFEIFPFLIIFLKYFIVSFLVNYLFETSKNLELFIIKNFDMSVIQCLMKYPSNSATIKLRTYNNFKTLVVSFVWVSTFTNIPYNFQLL